MTDALEALTRWENAGGIWRVIGRGAGFLTIGLFRCDGGEQVDVLRSDDAKLIAHVDGRDSNLD